MTRQQEGKKAFPNGEHVAAASYSSSPPRRPRRPLLRVLFSPYLIRKAVAVYVDYAKRLWTETNGEARRRIAADRAQEAVRLLKEAVHGWEEYTAKTQWRRERGQDVETVNSLKLEERALAEQARQRLDDACQEMLTLMAEIGNVVPQEGNVDLEEEEEAEAAETLRNVLESSQQETQAQSLLTPDDATSSTAFFPPPPPPSIVALPPPEINATTTSSSLVPYTKKKKKKKKRRSIARGAAIGAVVTCWVFSGNYIFTFLFTLMTVVGQLEYYRMVMNTGVYPARKTSVLGACSMFLTALFAPELHQICLPLFGMIAMIWFLTMKQTVSTIPEIATTFTGMFLLGYVPSFWVRTRLVHEGGGGGGGSSSTTRLAPLAKPLLDVLHQQSHSRLPSFIPKSIIHLPITTGAVFIFWTWLCIAMSDVGAYFVGKKWGRTKLGQFSPAAGATSPNKSLEGLVGGMVTSALFGLLGAWVMKWPLWFVMGPWHGMNLALLGLVGDLTASMLKRDAGIKDFGDLIPEHGGILDRVDSFIFNAPYGWLVCRYLIPALKTWAAGGVAAS